MAGRRARHARPSAPRSQHFLRTAALAAAIVRDADVGRDDFVVDLGAGGGRLTAELSRAARRVLAVELDPVWAAQLRGRWPNVEVVEGDAALVELPNEPFRVVANLPFDRTTALLRLLLDDPTTPLTRADLVVEWGLACKRAMPWPSTFNDVGWGAFYEISLGRRLPRSLFDPAPSVDAGVLIFRRRPLPLVSVARSDEYRRFVAAGFRRSPRSVASARALDRVGGRGALARDLDAHQWAELFRARDSKPSL